MPETCLAIQRSRSAEQRRIAAADDLAEDLPPRARARVDAAPRTAEAWKQDTRMEEIEGRAYAECTPDRLRFLIVLLGGQRPLSAHTGHRERSRRYP